ncbi:hypothetical protein CLV51_101945 [Chitinophaga niastensis]|uniref:Uncharacterized protein n=2 Tax=Chitinophaga niastensis TaxID=536980 RepID=A0A2P8HTP8_CHINA|nr:hypothetical protein CLV51_101945 [Chitinophaga niastensis]
MICDNYGEAGALNYYNNGKMPSAVCFDADYIYWFPKMDTIGTLLRWGSIRRGLI